MNFKLYYIAVNFSLKFLFYKNIINYKKGTVCKRLYSKAKSNPPSLCLHWLTPLVHADKPQISKNPMPIVPKSADVLI